MQIDWGNVPSWVSAATSMIALLAAAAAAIFAYETVANQRAELRTLMNERMQEHAVKISTWLEYSDDEAEVYYVVANTSGQPAYELLVWCTVGDSDGHYRTFRTVPPGSYYDADALPASDFDAAEARDLRVTCVFTDVHGRIWHRDSSGVLHDVYDYPLGRPYPRGSLVRYTGVDGTRG